jgi:hypothetical protein
VWGRVFTSLNHLSFSYEASALQGNAVTWGFGGSLQLRPLVVAWQWCETFVACAVQCSVVKFFNIWQREISDLKHTTEVMHKQGRRVVYNV